MEECDLDAALASDGSEHDVSTKKETKIAKVEVQSHDENSDKASSMVLLKHDL